MLATFIVLHSPPNSPVFVNVDKIVAMYELDRNKNSSYTDGSYTIINTVNSNFSVKESLAEIERLITVDDPKKAPGATILRDNK